MNRRTRYGVLSLDPSAVLKAHSAQVGHQQSAVWCGQRRRTGHGILAILLVFSTRSAQNFTAYLGLRPLRFQPVRLKYPEERISKYLKLFLLFYGSSWSARPYTKGFIDRIEKKDLFVRHFDLKAHQVVVHLRHLPQDSIAGLDDGRISRVHRESLDSPCTRLGGVSLSDFG